MTFRVTFNGDQVGRQYATLMAQQSARHRRALIAASGQMRDEALRAGRQNISNAGNFGTRWTKGLRGEVFARRGNVEIEFSHDVPYFSVFQFGKIIRGKPMLWIPFSFASDAQGVLARNFPGGLFKVVRNRDGLEMLWSVRDKEPKYFGKTSVRIPKKFRVLEIIREVSKQLQLFFTEQLQRQR